MGLGVIVVCMAKMETHCCFKRNIKMEKIETRVSPETVKVEELWICANCEHVHGERDVYHRAYGE